MEVVGAEEVVVERDVVMQAGDGQGGRGECAQGIVQRGVHGTQHWPRHQI